MHSKARTKVGNRKGNPGYRTPSGFRIRKSLNINRFKKIK